MKEYEFIWSDHSVKVEVFNQDSVEKEVRATIMTAANYINRKHIKQNKSSFNCLQEIILTKKEYEDMKDEEYVKYVEFVEYAECGENLPL